MRKAGKKNHSLLHAKANYKFSRKLHSSTRNHFHFVLESRVSREKKSMKLHLNPLEDLERNRKQRSEGKKFSFCITFKFSFVARFVKNTEYNGHT